MIGYVKFPLSVYIYIYIDKLIMYAHATHYSKDGTLLGMILYINIGKNIGK